MYYEHFLGMHMFWWLFWLFLFLSFFFFDVPKPRSKNNPYRILKDRFAAGEITEEEYRHKKAVLMEEFRKEPAAESKQPY